MELRIKRLTSGLTFMNDSMLHQSGGSKLRRPVNVHVEVFSEELAFFQLGQDVLDRFRQEEGLNTEV